MRIQYRAGSDVDIEQIYSYIKKRNLSGALNVLQAILDGVQRVAENPFAWQTTDDPEIRVFVLQRYRYKIFYTIVDNDTIEIMHVRHSSRRPWRAD